MTVEEGMEIIHCHGYGLGGHMAFGGPWTVTIYRQADGLQVAELDPASTWESAVGQAADWIAREHET